MPDNAGKPLRFASLIRVSTEAQEKMGESLRTQRKANERDVAKLGGSVVGWYGGQEHATPGHEKKEVDRLIADAGRGKFDAVIVAYADRWSRDNAKSEEGLEAFRRAGVAFYVGTMKMDPTKPEHALMMSLHGVIGKFLARTSSKKSMENRIARAQRRHPTCGKMPFGRTFNKATGEWGIDPAKQAMLAEIAARYLKGGSLQGLAAEYKVSASGLHKTFRHHSGDTWEQEFKSEEFGIHEVVVTPVPRLLPEATIKAVKQRLEANRTHLHGKSRHRYLLAGRIFCAACGYVLTGQTSNGNGERYYRHGHANGAKHCALNPKPWVRADKIEAHVVSDLFDVLGNPAAIERAVSAAVPDSEKAMKERERLQGQIQKVTQARNSVLNLIEKEALTVDQAEKKLTELKEREGRLREELDRVDAALAEVPDTAAVRRYVERVQESYGWVVRVIDEDGEEFAGGNDVGTLISMTHEDRQALLDDVFSTPMPDGRPAGVYITPGAGPTRQARPVHYSIMARVAHCVKQSTMQSPGVQRNTPPMRLDGTAK